MIPHDHNFKNLFQDFPRETLQWLFPCAEERLEVICQAYKGLFQLATRGLFDKYVEFIDVYSDISEQEQQQLFETISQDKETVMLSQYMREKGRREGRQEGRREAGYGLYFNIIQTIINKYGNGCWQIE